MKPDKRIGFTGTREGMTQDQRCQFALMLKELNASEFHHGDCIGADSEAHVTWLKLDKGDPVIHPPVVSTYRAYCESSRICEPKDYLMRNRDIVDATDVLLACPKEFDEQVRGSGTWYTIRYARQRGKQVIIIFPDGTCNNYVVADRRRGI